MMTIFIGQGIARALVLCSVLSVPLTVSGASTNEPDGGMLEVRMAPVLNYMHETCVDFEPGRALHYEFDSAFPVDFNIHHHTETTTEFPVKLRVDGPHEGTLALPDGGEYCFMWSNPVAQPDEFLIELRYRADTLESQPEAAVRHPQAPARTARPE